MQVRNLTQEMAASEAENERLTDVINAAEPHSEELLLHVKELQHVSYHLLVQMLLPCCRL